MNDLDPFDEDEDDPLLEIVVFLCYGLMVLAVLAVLLFEASKIAGG
jgi:hypothetical protein